LTLHRLGRLAILTALAFPRARIDAPTCRPRAALRAPTGSHRLGDASALSAISSAVRETLLRPDPEQSPYVDRAPWRDPAEYRMNHACAGAGDDGSIWCAGISEAPKHLAKDGL